MTYFPIYPISFSSVRDPQGDTFHLRVDDTFLPQATVVDLSGEAKTRPWTDRYPLAGWGILQGLADWDLCILFTADVRSEESLAESNGDQHLDPFLTDDAPEKEKKCSVLFFVFFPFHVTFADQFGPLGRKCLNETHLRVENIYLQSIPDAGWVIRESAGWHSSVSKLLLFLTACRERRLVRRGDLVLPGDVAAKHEGSKFAHRHSTAHLWSFSNISNRIFYALFFLLTPSNWKVDLSAEWH